MVAVKVPKKFGGTKSVAAQKTPAASLTHGSASFCRDDGD
jgi:hypothetical protein